ncbi:hypothetical protein NQ317_009494 [Molorchus minor]|uniref:Uncharacterized protein n=1 Tax=Molorchus minor TaxID=1323400 RepID=A0ABQ9JK05_9CUCU|nr:hypothetical protein NQ317_009494 [Molorchus minor]
MTAQKLKHICRSQLQLETVESYDGSIDDTKSVVISIPSPTPSQEQMLDNIALQALENRRREFECFEDVLDMIENIRAEPPPILEDNTWTKISPKLKKKLETVEQPHTSRIESQVTVNVSGNGKSSAVPQLSPLSQPTDLTTNMANASQQLRSLLSNLQTTSASIATNVETVAKKYNT